MNHCIVCKTSIEEMDKVEHHISYNPEKKIPLHRSCHTKIHHSKDPKWDKIKPRKEIEMGYPLIRTLQIRKDTLIDLNTKKLQYEAKIGKRISVDYYIQELLK